MHDFICGLERMSKGVQYVYAHYQKARQGRVHVLAQHATLVTLHRGPHRPQTTTVVCVDEPSVLPPDCRLISSNIRLLALVPSPATCAQLYSPVRQVCSATYLSTPLHHGLTTVRVVD